MVFFLLHEESLKFTYRYISRWLLDYVRLPAEEFITPNIFVSTGLRREWPHWKREGHTETRHTITWASITLILTGGGCARVAKRMSRSRRLGFSICPTPLYLAWRFIRFNNFHICLLRCIEVFEYSVFKFRLKYAWHYLSLAWFVCIVSSKHGATQVRYFTFSKCLPQMT